MAVDRDSYLRHVFNTVAAYYGYRRLCRNQQEADSVIPSLHQRRCGNGEPRPLQVLVGWVASFSGDLGRGFCEVR
jgi:hypothetical protein